MRPPTQRGLQDKEQTPCGGPGSPAHTAWETRLRRARSRERGDGHASCPTRTLWDGPRTPGTPRTPTLTVQGLQLQEGGGAHLTRPLAGLRLRGGAAVRGARSCQREGKNVSPAAPPPGGPGPSGPRRHLSSALTVPAVGAHAPLGLPVPSVARGLIRPCECPHFTGEETEHGGAGGATAAWRGV